MHSPKWAEHLESSVGEGKIRHSQDSLIISAIRRLCLGCGTEPSRWDLDRGFRGSGPSLGSLRGIGPQVCSALLFLYRVPGRRRCTPAHNLYCPHRIHYSMISLGGKLPVRCRLDGVHRIPKAGFGAGHVCHFVDSRSIFGPDV